MSKTKKTKAGPIVERERRHCRLMGARHVGGPNRVDCVRGETKIELKHHKSPLTASKVLRELEKPQYARGRVKVCATGRGGLAESLVAKAPSLGLRIRGACAVRPR